MLSAIVLIPPFLLSRWISFPRVNVSSPRLFLSKLEVIITFFELCRKIISHLQTLHICNLLSWPLIKTQNFLCSHKILDITIQWSDFIRWYSDVLFFPQQKEPFGYAMYILSWANLHREVLLQHPSDAILKAVCHQLHYDSKRILSWDWIKCLIITYSFLCTKLFAISCA